MDRRGTRPFHAERMARRQRRTGRTTTTATTTRSRGTRYVRFVLLAMGLVFVSTGGRRRTSGIGFGRVHALIEREEGVRVVTKEELRQKTEIRDDGTGELWLAILGEVYNVTAGAKHYSEGSAYHVFVGRDGSAAFVTGNFTPAGAETSLYEALTPQQIAQLETWREFYHKEDKYEFVGVLEGELYDSDGKPTEEMKRVERDILEGKRLTEEKNRRNKELREKRKKEQEEKKRAKEKAAAAAAAAAAETEEEL